MKQTKNTTTKVAKQNETQSGVKTPKTDTKKTLRPTDKDGIYEDENGNKYKMDMKKHTFKKVLASFKDIDVNDINFDKFPIQTYQKCLKATFTEDSVVLKKDKIHFRDYVIGYDNKDGFSVKDARKKYEVVSDFDGIPTPKELVEFFNRPKRVPTPEETREAYERGKLAEEEARKAKEEAESMTVEDYKDKVIRTIHRIQDGKEICEDPIATFKDAIPHKQWRRKCNAIIKQWLERKIRFKKFLTLMETMTEEQNFEVPRPKAPKFVGTLLPDYHKVGNLVGDKLEVDGKLVYAVPFLVEWMLHFEPKMMPQYMKFAKGEITEMDFIKNPIEDDDYVEYKKNALQNSARNAQIVTCAMTQAGVLAPQQQLFSDDLKVGDRIYLYDPIVDDWVYKDICKVKGGVEINREVGLLKSDVFIVVGHRDILKLPYRFNGVENNEDTEELNKEAIVSLNNFPERLQAFYPFDNHEVNGTIYKGVRIYFGKKDGDAFEIYGYPQKIMMRIRKFLLQGGIDKFEDLEKGCKGDRYELPK